MPHMPTKRQLVAEILQLLPEAVRAFPHDDPRVQQREVTTISDQHIHGKTTVDALPNSLSWSELDAALRADGVIEVAVDYRDPTHHPDAGVHVTSRHTTPKKLGSMDLNELLSVRQLLTSIVA